MDTQTLLNLGLVLLFVMVGGVFAGTEIALVSLRGGMLYLDQISVHPDQGQRGIGAALLTRVIDEAKRRKLRRVALSTFRDLPWNAPFYARLGFEVVQPVGVLAELRAREQERGLDEAGERVVMRLVLRRQG